MIAKPISTIQTQTQTIKTENELFFGFRGITHCKNSKRELKNNTELKKSITNSLLQLTEFFYSTNASSKTLAITGVQAPSDYKQLSGNGINNNTHKFKLNKAISVLTTEEEDSNKLLISLSTIGNFHK